LNRSQAVKHLDEQLESKSDQFVQEILEFLKASGRGLA
jgi:hypothetical protein